MPTQSVLDRMKVVQDELKAAHAKADAFFGKELAALNKSMEKEKLRPIAVIDRAEFERQFEKAAGPGDPGKNWQEKLRKMLK